MKNHRSKLAELMVVFLCVKEKFLIILKNTTESCSFEKDILPKVAQDSQLMSYDQMIFGCLWIHIESMNY